MSIRLISLISLIVGLGLDAAAQDEGPKFIFDTGTPPWRGERIPLPPSFATDLGWKGVEEIRFAPGMFEAESESFFSYVLVFLLEPGSDISEAGLKRELLTYYRGLSKAVMESKQRSVDTSGFTVTLAKAEKADPVPAGAADVAAFTATLEWLEPFATQKDQTLHLEVHTWKHGDQLVVLSCVSPVKPDGGALWKSLRDIRAKFRFEP
jgi:hypothetical protein